MAPKNIDETIQKLLKGYAKWCDTVLQKDTKALQKKKFYTEKDRTKANQECTRAKKAYEYLLEIAANPKKYLYTEKDIIYSDVVDYNKLSPILGYHFDRTKNGPVLVRLSEAIAHHVKYGQNDHNGVWVYYGEPNQDFEAQKIIKMNKVVQLWNANDFVAALKDFAPASIYAVDYYKKEK